MSILKIFLRLTLTFLIAASCSTFKTQPKADLNSVTYQGLLEHHSQWQKAVKTLKGNLRITLDTPKYSGNFDASILMNEPDSMLITVTGPFGMHLGKVYTTRNRFIFYNQIMNQFFKGFVSDFEGHNFLQFPLEITQLKNTFVARDYFNIIHKESFEVKDNKYFLQARNANYSYKIWFEADLLLISKIEYLRDGKILFFKEYDNYREVNGIYFPHLVNFVRPDEKEGIAIIITELELNKAIDPDLFRINISDSATQIDLTL